MPPFSVNNANKEENYWACKLRIGSQALEHKVLHQVECSLAPKQYRQVRCHQGYPPHEFCDDAGRSDKVNHE